MARRDGQIIARGERKWLVRWHMGLETDSGKYRYSSKMVHGTKRDAQKFLNQVLRSRDLGSYVEPSQVTLNTYLDRWLEAGARPRVSPRTYEDYKWNLGRYARPALGDRRLDQIRPLDLQRWLSALGKKGLSARTIRIAHWILSSALKQAVRWDMLAANPAERVDPPRQRPREMRALTAEEVARFRKAASESPHAVLFDFLLGTGCQPGEALAVRWRDLDLKTGVVRIVRALSRAQGRPVFKEPKSGRGRAIPIPSSLVQALVFHRKLQAERAMKLGVVYAREEGLVFANEIGLPLDLRNVTQRHFKPALKAAKLPAAIRLYDLRHTSATLLLASGVHPKVAAERLGHASTRMTLDVYSHVLPGMQEEAAELLGAVLFDG